VEYPPAEMIAPKFASGERLSVFTADHTPRPLRADARFRNGIGAPLKLVSTIRPATMSNACARCR